MAAIQVKQIPKSVVKHILKMQRSYKEKKGVRQYSQSLTLIQMAREHEEFLELIKKPS